MKESEKLKDLYNKLLKHLREDSSRLRSLWLESRIISSKDEKGIKSAIAANERMEKHMIAIMQPMYQEALEKETLE